MAPFKKNVYRLSTTNEINQDDKHHGVEQRSATYAHGIAAIASREVHGEGVTLSVEDAAVVVGILRQRQLRVVNVLVDGSCSRD